jgi:DNA adenine methylase
MRYLGGKHRQSKTIRTIIAELRGNRSRYLEPFMGGGSVFSAVAPDFEHATGADASESLAALWQAVLIDGWEPPAVMTRETWESERDSTEQTALRAWAGYAASYNGKWFAGYGPSAAGRDYLAESARGIARKAARVVGHPDLSIMHADYAVHTVDASTVIYCDPPYEGTESYGAVDSFDHTAFWQTAQQWSETGALVLVHEYGAPDGWAAVHSRERVETMHHGGPSSGARAEVLFRYGG